MSGIYFDNNATTAIDPAVLDAMLPYLSHNYGNPSSAHGVGRDARKIVDESRSQVARLIGASENEIVFTSGGTESDNWAILGALEMFPERRHIVTTRVEHEAVRKLCEKLSRNGYEVTWIGVDSDGALDSDEVRRSLRPDTAVVSVMMANNETGVLFPVAHLAEIVKSECGAVFHVDGVNAAGKVGVDLGNTAIDMFSLSGHKFHAPKGVGALYVRNGIGLPSRFIGGGQESGRRAGTEAIHQIAALGKAAELANDLSNMDRVGQLRDRLENEILQKIPNSRLNGTSNAEHRLPNTSNISFVGVNGEMILARLDAEGISVSTGSACNSETRTVSPVLAAMEIPFEQAMGSIRFSLGRFNSADEIDIAVPILERIVGDLRRISG